MIYPTRKGVTIRGPLAPMDWENQQCHEVAQASLMQYIESIGEIDERGECLEYQLEKEDYNDLTHEERMAEEAAVDRYLDQREDREQDMLEAQWHKAEQEEQPVPTVTALIRNGANQLLYVMGTDGQWELPWGPITAHGDHDHEVYSAHEMDSMMSLANMVLSTLGVRIASCQWVSKYRADGDDYEVTLVDYPEVDGVTVKWQ